MVERAEMEGDEIPYMHARRMIGAAMLIPNASSNHFSKQKRKHDHAKVQWQDDCFPRWPMT